MPVDVHRVLAPPAEVAEDVDPRSSQNRPLQWCISGVGLVSFAAVVFGIWLMHRQADFPFSWFPSAPILERVFPNPRWAVLGTICALSGALLAYIYLPVYWSESRRDMVRRPVRRVLLSSLTHLRRERLALMLSGLGVALYIYVLQQATTHQSSWWALVALISAVGCALTALHTAMLRSGREQASTYRMRMRDYALVLMFAAVFVVANIYDARYWLYAFTGDEWAFYGFARVIAQGANPDFLSQAGVYGIHAVANSAYQALVMRVAGSNVTGWRLSSVLSVALSLPILYWGAREIAGSVYAVVAAALYASCNLLWAFSHIGYNANDPLLAMIPAAMFAYIGVRDDRLTFLFAAGACAGAGWYTLFTGRLMIVALVVFLLTEWRGGWIASRARLLVLLAGFILVVLPLFIDNGYDTIRQMFPLVSLSKVRTASPVSDLLSQNSIRGAYSFFYINYNGHFVINEIFDIVSSSGLLLGIALCLRRIRDTASRLFLVWFISMIGLTTPLYYAPQIADTRLQVAVPAAALLAALGLCSAAHATSMLVAPRLKDAVFGLSICSLIATAFSFNWYKFHVEMPPLQQVTLLSLTIGALSHTTGSTVLLAGDVSNFITCQVAEGYGFDTGALVYFSGRKVSQQCIDPPHPLLRRSSVAVLLNGQVLPQLTSCSLRFVPLVKAPNGTQSIWAARFTIPPSPASSYRQRIATALARSCSGLHQLRS